MSFLSVDTMAKLASLILAVFCLSSRASAQCGGFTFANSYGSSMVLQRAPGSANIWGYTETEGTVVTVTMGADNYQATSALGPTGLPTWRVTLNPQSTPGPFVIDATANACTITLDDVLFGDVYVCSGQSNMAFRMDEIDNPDPDITDSVNYPDVRTIKSALVESDVPLYDLGSGGITQPWSRPDGGTQIAAFSALCWLFGRNLNAQLGVPIGLIQSAWGGTRIEAWTSTEGLEICWPGGTVPPGDGQNAPSALWNAMIHPYLEQTIYGAIWYQGEANQGNYQDYDCAIQAMVGDWRSNWFTSTGSQTDPEFPFGQVQLAPNGDNDNENGFPDVRWAQTYNAGYTPNTDLVRIYTAIALDLPDFNSPSGAIHPRYKRQIAERMFYAVMQVGYGDSSRGEYQGPIPTNAVVGATVTIEYDNGAAVLEQRDTTGYELCCADNPTDRCQDGAGTWTDAPISAVATSSVDLTNPCVSPQVVTGMRYVWRESPCPLEQCAIYRVENELPAGPFLMDI